MECDEDGASGAGDETRGGGGDGEREELAERGDGEREEVAERGDGEREELAERGDGERERGREIESSGGGESASAGGVALSSLEETADEG